MCRPFLLGEPYGDARMGMARILGVCGALLFASSVSAANIIDLGPSDYRNYGTGPASHTANGVRSSVGQTVRMPPTLNTLNVTRNPVVPYGSIANGMRSFVRVSPQSIAASAAITGLFIAVDWIFDEASGQWSKSGFEQTDPLAGGFYNQNVPQGHQYGGPFPSPDDACEAYALFWGRNSTVEAVLPADYGRFTCTVRAQAPFSGTSTTVQSPVDFECPEGSTYSADLGFCAVEAYIDLDPSDWQELTDSLPQRSPEQVATAGRDVMVRQGGPLPGYTDTKIAGPDSFTGADTTSTSTDPVSGDTIVTNTSTETHIEYGDTTITTTNTTTTTTYQNGQETSTTVTTETPGELPVSSGGGAAGDWPGFCEWATVVCDWFDWTQEDPPPEQDLPALVDDDFYAERDISFGSKSCPEPYQVNLAPFMDTQVSVSFQPLCDFAGLIYYMVMAASYIIAAYISIGVARA